MSGSGSQSVSQSVSQSLSQSVSQFRRSLVKQILLHSWCREGLVEQLFFIFPLDRLGRAVLLHFSFRRSLVNNCFFILGAEKAW